jgi:hypothetical protein
VTAPGIVVHRIRKDKGADTFRELVGKYKGVIVCDAAKTQEARARAGDDLAKKGELRRVEARAVLDKLKTWLWGQAVLAALSIGQAAAYVIANWERLTRFTEDARIPLDNNATERAIRGPSDAGITSGPSPSAARKSRPPSTR